MIKWSFRKHPATGQLMLSAGYRMRNIMDVLESIKDMEEPDLWLYRLEHSENFEGRWNDTLGMS